jgi:hypothetical protein
MRQTTTSHTYRGHTAVPRERPRPTSNTRHNNPQASQSFKLTRLPTGELLNVAARPEDGLLAAQPIHQTKEKKKRKKEEKKKRKIVSVGLFR